MFEKGNQYSKGNAGGGRKSRKFIETCEKLLDGDPELMGVKGAGALDRIKKILLGFDGVTPELWLKTAMWLASYTEGKPVEHSVNENINTNMQGYSKEELLTQISELMKDKQSGRVGESGEGTDKA
jgi:hypothetical protein